MFDRCDCCDRRWLFRPRIMHRLAYQDGYMDVCDDCFEWAVLQKRYKLDPRRHMLRIINTLIDVDVDDTGRSVIRYKGPMRGKKHYKK